MSSVEEFDVAVVGASIAGCTAARLFAQAGARVALIERHEDPDAYKVVCTHAVLSPATPVIERLGLAPQLEARGALRTWPAFWTPYGGWVNLPEDVPEGWGVTRRTLDPLLRKLAVNTPGVEYLPGWTARRILDDTRRPSGVEAEGRDGRVLRIRARLLVGADGRGSCVARLARVAGRVRPHNRFFYFAYWRGIEQPKTARGPEARLWILDPEGGAEFPNEDGLTVLVAAFHRSRMKEVRADVEGSYMRQIASLPEGPDLTGGERVSKILGKLEMPNVMRPAARPGMAFVGDAALATDPVFGVGITFAFQSAAWLVDETKDALGDERDLDSALRRYRRRFLWRLGPHHLQIASFSTGRKLTPFERFAFRRAARDPKLARELGMIAARERSALHLLGPRFNGRVLMAA